MSDELRNLRLLAVEASEHASKVFEDRPHLAGLIAWCVVIERVGDPGIGPLLEEIMTIERVASTGGAG